MKNAPYYPWRRRSSSVACVRSRSESHAKTPRRKDLRVFLCVLASLRETSGGEEMELL